MHLDDCSQQQPAAIGILINSLVGRLPERWAARSGRCWMAHWHALTADRPVALLHSNEHYFTCLKASLTSIASLSQAWLPRQRNARGCYSPCIHDSVGDESVQRPAHLPSSGCPGGYFRFQHRPACHAGSGRPACSGCTAPPGAWKSQVHIPGLACMQYGVLGELLRLLGWSWLSL